MAEGNAHLQVTSDSKQAQDDLKAVDQKLKKLGETSSNTQGSFEKFSSGLAEFGRKMQIVGRNLSIALTLPIVGLGKEIIETGSSLDAFESTFLQSLKGMAGTATDFANTYANTVGMTSTQVRQQVLEFNKFARAMGMSQEESYKFSESMLKLTNDLSAYFDVDVADATDRMKSALMGNYNAVDRLGLAFGEASIKEEMLREGLKGQFSELDGQKKMWLLYNLAVKQGADSQGQAAREAENFQGKMRELKGTLEELYEKVFKVLEPQLLEFVQALTGLVDKLKTLNPEQIKMLTTFALFLALLPPIVLYIGWVVESFSILGGAVFKMGKFLFGAGEGFKSLSGVIALTKAKLGPVIASMGTFIAANWVLIAVIAAVVAIAYLMYKNWDKVKAIASSLKDKFIELKDKALDKVHETMQYLSDKATEFKDKLIKLKDEGVDKVKDAWNDFKTKLEESKQTIIDVATVLGVIFGPALAKTGVEAMIAGGKIAITYVSSLWAAGSAAIVNAAKIIASFVAAMITTGIEAVINGAKVTISFIGSMIKAGAEALIAGAKIAITFVGALITAGAEAVIAGGKILVGFVGSLITMGIEAIKTAAIITTKLIAALISYALEGWKTVAAIAAQTLAWIAQKVALIASTIATWAMSAAVAALNIAMAIGTGIAGGFSVAISFLTSPIGLVVLAVIALIAICVALYKNWDKVKAKALDVWNGIKSAVASAIDWIGNKIDSFKQKISNMFAGIKTPHFTFTGSINPLNWADQGMPKIGVDWYATGGIATGPSIVGIGEAGDEAILPLSNKSKMKPFAEAVARLMPDVPRNSTNEYNQGVNITVGSLVVREEADIQKIAKEIVKLQEKKDRAKGGLNFNG